MDIDTLSPPDSSVFTFAGDILTIETDDISKVNTYNLRVTGYPGTYPSTSIDLDF